MSASEASLLRFGVFELDLKTGELRKAGVLLHLPPQPFKILALLACRPGQLVTREEIQQEIWGSETFVDFELGLNAAIKTIRDVVGDDAETPRYIQTLPRRGYRFIAPVEPLTPGPSPRGRGEERLAGSGPSPDGRGEPEPVSISQPSPLGRGWPRDPGAGEGARTQRRRILAAAVAAAAVIMAALVGYLLTRPLPPPKVVSSVQITKDGQAKFPPVLTDGSRLFYMGVAANGFALYQVSIAGGEAAAISTPFFLANLVSMSPDGAELLVQAREGTLPEGPLWIFPSLAGPSHRLGSVLSSDAAWSPDGKTLVYARGQDLYVAQPDGTESRKLVTVPGNPSWIRRSPDQKVLRLTIWEPKTSSQSLWEVTADGTNLHALLPDWNNPAAECCGSWTPDGKYFVFQSTRSGRTDIWAIGGKGSLLSKPRPQPIQLTTGPLSFLGPVPSNDGKRLFVIGAQPRGELARYDAKSGQFLPYLSGMSADGVDFSRDAKWVTYVAQPDGNLWRSKVDGSERLQLTFPPMTAVLPRWSPDGKRIAFQGISPGNPWGMYLVSSNGGTPEKVMPGMGDVGWSADGNSLVFSDTPPFFDPNSSGQLALHILDLRTHQVTTLPGSEGLYSPRWSPDGRYIAALRPGPENLLLFDFTKKNWVELEKLPLGYPSWSRDSKYIYFDSPTGTDPAFYRVRISDHKVEKIISLKNLRLTGTVGWTGLASDDSPLVLRDVGTQEIYALDWQAP